MPLFEEILHVSIPASLSNAFFLSAVQFARIFRGPGSGCDEARGLSSQAASLPTEGISRLNSVNHFGHSRRA